MANVNTLGQLAAGLVLNDDSKFLKEFKDSRLATWDHVYTVKESKIMLQAVSDKQPTQTPPVNPANPHKERRG